MNVLGIAGNTSLPYISFVKTSVAKPWKEVSEAARTFLRKDLMWRVAVARVPRRRKRKRKRRRRVKPRGEYRARMEVETEKEREKEEMSFSLKKSCPNKGALFHAQCTPPQTRSLRYLSLRGARSSSALLFHTPRVPFPFFPLSLRPSRMARHFLWVYAFLPAKCPRDVIAAR